MKKNRKLSSLFKLSTITPLAMLFMSSVAFAQNVTETTPRTITEDISYTITSDGVKDSDGYVDSSDVVNGSYSGLYNYIYSAISGSDLEFAAGSSLTGNITTTFESGSVAKVFAGDAYGTTDITGNIIINVTGGEITTSLYGTSYLGRSNYSPTVTGDIEINVSGGTVAQIRGGFNSTSTALDLDSDGTYESDGISQAIERMVLKGNIYITISDDAIISADGDNESILATGGSYASLTGDTTVTITGGSVAGRIFGGSSKTGTDYTVSYDEGTGEYTYTVSEGTVIGVDDTNIIISGGTVGESSDSTDAIFGGGVKYSIVGGDTNIEISGGTVYSHIYGGGDYETIVFGDSNIEITGGTIKGNIYGSGGNIDSKADVDAGIVLGDANISIGGTAYITGNIYGAKDDATIGGNVSIDVSGGTITGSIYGGSTFGNVEINVSNATLSGATSIIAASDTVSGNVSVNISEGTDETTSAKYIYITDGGTIGTSGEDTTITYTQTGGSIYAVRFASSNSIEATVYSDLIYNISGGNLGEGSGLYTDPLFVIAAGAYGTVSSENIVVYGDVTVNIGSESGSVSDEILYNSQVAASSYATKESSYGTVLGNASGTVYGDIEISILSSTVKSIFATSYASVVDGNTSITLSENAYVEGNLYNIGGLSSDDVTSYVSAIAGDTSKYIAVSGNTSLYLYGDVGGYVVASTYRSSVVIGGSSYAYIDGSNIAGAIYGVSAGTITGNLEIELVDASVGGSLYGVYGNASVGGNLDISLSGNTSVSAIYGETYGTVAGTSTLNFEGFSASVGVADFDNVYVKSSSTLNVTSLTDSAVSVESGSDLNVVVNSSNADSTTALVSNVSIEGVSVVDIIIDNVYAILDTETTIYDSSVTLGEDDASDSNFVLEADWSNYYTDETATTAAVTYENGVLSVESSIYYSDASSESSASVEYDSTTGEFSVEVDEGSFSLESGTITDTNINTEATSTGSLVIDGATLNVTSSDGGLAESDNFTLTNSSTDENGVYVDSGVVNNEGNTTNALELADDYTLTDGKSLEIIGGKVAGGSASSDGAGSTYTFTKVELTDTLEVDDNSTIAGSVTYNGTDTAVEANSESGELKLADGLVIDLSTAGNDAVAIANDDTLSDEDNGLNLLLQGSITVKGGTIKGNSPITISADGVDGSDDITEASDYVFNAYGTTISTLNEDNSGDDITVTGVTLNLYGTDTATTTVETGGEDINLIGAALTIGDYVTLTDVGTINMTTDSAGTMSTVSVSGTNNNLGNTTVTVVASAAMLVGFEYIDAISGLNSVSGDNGEFSLVNGTITVNSLSYFTNALASNANEKDLAAALDAMTGTQADADYAAKIAFKVDAESNGLSSYVMNNYSQIAEVNNMLLSNQNFANVNRARAILAKSAGVQIEDEDGSVSIENEDGTVSVVDASEVSLIKYSNVAQLQSINLLGSKDGNNGVAGYDYWSVGSTANFDEILSENALVGVSIGGTYNKVESDAGESANSTTFLLNAYAVYANEGFEAFGNIGYAHFWNEGYNSGSNADWDSDSFNFLVGVSYDIATGVEGLTITPLAMFNMVLQDSESASYSNGVDVNSESYFSAKLMLGIELEYAINAQFNAILRTIYVSEMGDETYDFTYGVGSYISGLNYQGNRAGSNAALIGLGLSYDFSETCTAYFDYNAYAYSELITHSLNLSVALKF